MKRDEFKLLMEDWKRNFVAEDEVVPGFLNEGYTELDRMILEEGLKDMPIINTAKSMLGVVAVAALLKFGGIDLLKQTLDNVNPDNRAVATQSVNNRNVNPAGVGSFSGYEDAEISSDYKELLQDKDVKEVQDDFNEDLENQDFKTYKDSQEWFKSNSVKYAEKIADEVEKDVGIDGIPGAEDLGQDAAHDELVHQATKLLYQDFNTSQGYSQKAPK